MKKRRAKRRIIKVEEPDISGFLNEDKELLSFPEIIDYKNRTILISNIRNGNLTVQMAAILRMAAEDSKTPITLFIRSAGGSLNESLMFIEIMNSVECDFNTIAFETCFNSALLIFCNGKKRSCFNSTKFMAHEITISEESMLVCDMKKRAQAPPATRKTAFKPSDDATGLRIMGDRNCPV